EKSSEKPVVNSITYVSLDLDGYITPKLWLYVVPNSTHRLILGKKWLEDEDAIIHAKEERLELRKKGGCIFNTKRWTEEFETGVLPEITSVNVVASMTSSVPICRASLEDISKALRIKPQLTTDEARSRLPKEIKDFAHLFADDSGADELPPSRGQLDHVLEIMMGKSARKAQE
ncbi:hypothetical protein K3495_g15281, partial [Podosphaera aphanis]